MATARDATPAPARPLRLEVAACARAPMRVSLAGGGTDIPPLPEGTGGRVVGAAIDLYVTATVEPFDAGWVRLDGSWGTADVTFAADDRPPTSQREISVSEWDVRSAGSMRMAPCSSTFTRRASDPPSSEVSFRLVEAVRAAFGVEGGVRIFVESDLTPGTGLGGSASAAVALLAAFHAATRSSVPAQRLATDATFLEREVLALRCGLQDQLCAAVGGVLDLRFFDDAFEVGVLDLSPSFLADLSAGLLLVDTRLRRVSGEVLDAAPEPSGGDVKAELVAAAQETALGLREGSLRRVIEGMRRSASAKIRRGGASALPRDWVNKLSELGADVVRMCGAGAGGHLLVWAEPSRHDELIRAVGQCIVRQPELGVSGAKVVWSQPAG